MSMELNKADHNESMLLNTPFHTRLESACEMNEWEDWKGYKSPAVFTDLAQEYFAMRNSCGVFDLSPMIKYRIEGPDATAYLDKLMTRNMSKQRVGQVLYAIWCDDEGQVLDDGTVFRLEEQSYRLCSAGRHMDWLQCTALGFDVEIIDETADVAALAVQGPTSCHVLRRLGWEGLENLKPFNITSFDFRDAERGDTSITVSRTGFTGDLGYELWLPPHCAESLWDKLMEAGKDRHILPIGSHALDMVRMEAGFLQAGVDFIHAETAVRSGRTRSPFELGFGWLVHLDKAHFNGRKALFREKTQGSPHQFVKLDVAGNRPAEHAFIYNKHKKAIGSVTSAAWSPITKTNIAFASVDTPWGNPGTELYAEIYFLRELKWTREMVKCTIVEEAAYNPAHRRAVPALSL